MNAQFGGRAQDARFTADEAGCEFRDGSIDERKTVELLRHAASLQAVISDARSVVSNLRIAMNPGLIRGTILTLLAVVACSPGIAMRGSSDSGASAAATRELLLNPSSPEWRSAAPERSHLRFETTKGVFVLELIREWGSVGADRLYNLVRLGYYNDTRLHRVNRNYIAQWGLHGDSAVNAAWRSHVLQDDPPRSRNARGTFAFAMKGANTRNTQIYINLADNPRSDGEAFTILGTVVEGMAALDGLYAGYGENSGSGVRQGRQGPLENGGNAFMDLEYPLLDRIHRAIVVDRP
jgi:homoserine O-acetyltransferase